MVNATIWMTLSHGCGTSLRERSHAEHRTMIFRSVTARVPSQEWSEKKKQSEGFVIVRKPGEDRQKRRGYWCEMWSEVVSEMRT